MELNELYDILIPKLELWAQEFIAALPNLVAALLIVIVFWVLSRVAHKLSDRALGQIQTNRAARALMTTFVRFAVLTTGIVIALGVLNLDKALASILAGAGVVGLALGFAFQDLAANMISGVGLAINKELPFKIGDIVETNGVLGTVRQVHLRTSILDTFDGKRVIIPNKQVYQDKVVNYSVNGQLRVDLECGVSYGDNLEEVQRIAKAAMEGVSSRDPSRDVELYFKEFGDSSINFVARFWIDYAKHSDYLAAQSEAICRLKRAFDEGGIMIPFPIRTLDFGIRGGERLQEVLASTPLRLSRDGTPPE